MLKFDSSLATTLANASDKLDWSTKLIAALGSSRTLRCFRDADPDAEEPADTGIEFVNVGMTGTLTSTAGNIVVLGRTEGFTIHDAADLTTGSSVLRIEGNGHWVQGTLGLTGSGKDFTMSTSPTITSGIGFSTLAAIRAPRRMASGTGPVAPGLGNDAPYSFTVEDWQDPDNPVEVGTAIFDTQLDDLVFADTDLAAEMGDVRVDQCSTTVVYEDFEFGATMMSMNGVVNEGASNTINQVLIACKPYGLWDSFPAMDTYDATTCSTFPKPFKIVLKREDGSTLHTYEMRDGLAINDPSLSQYWVDAPTALRPFFNCAMMLPWSSGTPRTNSHAVNFFPGMTDESLRPSQGKNGASINQPIPLATNRFQINSAGHWIVAPEWPIKFDTVYGSTLDTEAIDPYSFDITTYHNSEGHAYRIYGWNYEPGSISGHDWYTGPGGPRFDRTIIPAAIALYMSNPDGSRLKGNVPWKTIRDKFGLAYFNHSHHYLTDVQTFDTISTTQVQDGEWSYARSYYAPNTNYRAYNRQVDQFAISNGSNWVSSDKDGLHHYCGWALDFLHNYGQPGWYTMLFNSPMHLISAKLRYHANWLAQIGGAAGDDPTSLFFDRRHAWRIMHLAVMWKIATSHPLGIDRSVITEAFKAELEAIYDYVYVPTVVQNSSSYFCTGLRNFGIPGILNDNGSTKYVGPLSDYKTFYFSQLLAIMKTTGSWDAMRAESTKCQVALDFIITCLDKYSIDYFMDTEGRGDGVFHNLSATVASGATLTLPANWAAWGTTVYPKVGQHDWIHNSNGTIYVQPTNGTLDRDVSQHLRAQYVFMRRDYFPEISNARLEDCCTLLQGYYDTIAARVATGATPTDQRNLDWVYRLPNLGILKPMVGEN